MEQLKPLPGWEDWARGKKLRRRLDYDSDRTNENPCQEKIDPQEEKERDQKETNPTGRDVDVQKWLAKTGIEFHWPGYQYMGPVTHLAKRLKRGDPAWTRLLNNTTSITAMPGICKTNGKPILR